MAKCKNCGEECNCYEVKNLKPPANINLPFVAYGIFRPGDISFLFLKDYLEVDPIRESIIGDIRIRDGVLIFSNKDADSPGSRKEKIDVYILKFKKEQSSKAYKYIYQKEPDNLYEWGEIKVGGELCNILIAKDIENGSSRDFDGEALSYYSIKNIYWKEVLKLVEIESKQISSSKNDPDFSQQNHTYIYRLFLKTQQLYILQWTELERFAYFRFPGANSKHRGDSLFKLINSNGLGYYLDFKLKQDKIYNILNLKENYKLTKNNKLGFEYYNALRNNIVHSGKTYLEDFPKLEKGLKEIYIIVKRIIEDTEKECKEIKKKYEKRN